LQTRSPNSKKSKVKGARLKLASTTSKAKP
jgi:hypothetical protein